MPPLDMEKLMPVMIDKLTVASAAPAGTVVGTMTLLDANAAPLVAQYMLQEGSAGFFGISGAKIVTVRTPIQAGNYFVDIRVNAQRVRSTDKASFVISVT
jgi:hypothetical protein